jgi:ribonuclease HII
MKQQKNIIGLDEAGRGPWAGPLVVAAVRLKERKKLPKWLCDSKLLNETKIISCYKELVPLLDIGLSVIEPETIDIFGLSKAVRCGFTQALKDLTFKGDDEAIVDGNIDYLADVDVKSRALIDADALEQIVSAASIVAKYKRDEIMRALAVLYPEYGLEKSKGYGTKAHVEALQEFGTVKGLHRFSYKPVNKIATELSLRPPSRNPRTQEQETKNDTSEALSRLRVAARNDTQETLGELL